LSREVAERRRAQDYLRLLSTAVEQSSEGIAIADLEGNLLFVNSAFATMHGYEPGELVGKHLSIFHTPEEMSSVEAANRQIKETGEFTGEIWHVRRDGTVFPGLMHNSLLRDETDGPIGMIGTLRDISERKEAEEALQRSREELRAILDNVGIGIALISPDMEILELNRQMREWFPNIDAAQRPICYRAYNEPPRDGPCSYCPTIRTLRDGQVHESVTDTPAGDEVRHYRIVSSPIKDKSEKVVAAIEMVEDITERTHAEERVAAAYRELEAVNEELRRAIEQTNQLAIEAEMASVTKSQFLANMSHEIRTPMNAIVGMVELMLDTELTAEQREYLMVVRDSTDTLLHLINDILDLARVEAGRMELEAIDFHLRDSLGDSLKLLAVRAHEKGLELAYEIAPEVPDLLVGDPRRLRQVVTNLVGNAIKFTEEGQVVVRVETESETEQEAQLHFSVADTGIGIPEDKQRLIFEAFAQVDGSAARKYGGTGLGLTISAQLVEAMGGRIWVESEPGKGSTFHFTACLGVAAEPLPALPTQPVDIQDLPVLVVDDNATSRRILGQMLSNWQMKPTVVGSGREALEVMQRARREGREFVLAVLDVHMPEMDGFTLAERIKQDPELAESRIIVLTSAGQRGDAARCRKLGIAGYLTKPVKQSELWDVIMLTLGAPPSERRPARLVTRHSLREGRQRRRILLAEDNEVNQKVAARMLEKRGHTVVVARNGREALEALQRDAFDLVLMDVQMPEMDGFEAAAAIREQEKTTGKHLPIVAMTAHAMEGDRERCLAAGMDGYVPKPVRAGDLFAAIEQLLHAARELEVPPLEQAETEKVLDMAALMDRVEGDKQLLREILLEYFKSRPRMMSEIERAIGHGDGKMLERAAHALKGAVGTLGAKVAFDAALRLETIGRGGDLREAEGACGALKEELARLQKALAALGTEERKR